VVIKVSLFRVLRGSAASITKDWPISICPSSRSGGQGVGGDDITARGGFSVDGRFNWLVGLLILVIKALPEREY